jgi:hypothetical protein
MTIHVLFDEARRKELHGAILSGKPIVFRGREPKIDNPEPELSSSQAAKGAYDGRILIGESIRVGGFDFIYNGPVAGNNIAMGIRCGEGLIETKTLPMGRETVFDYPAEGTRVRVDARVCEKSQMQAAIVVESMYAELD